MPSMKYLKGRKQMVWIIVPGLLLLIFITVIAFINQPEFGRRPSGERLERIKRSPNYRDGKFQNLSPTQQITSDKSWFGIIAGFLFDKVEDLRPETALPAIKTELKQFKREEEVMVWLGHSSLFLQTGGLRFLIDPTLVSASPVSFFNQPFKGTGLYHPEDMPEIDYLIITHDHWDHLDYHTVKQLNGRIGKVICPLGVGEHFEYWGFTPECIVELDWMESISPNQEFTIYCLPARHFSGRGLSPNQTLWASFMLQGPSRKIYISGDGGFDTHFAAISRQFGEIDLAIMENGQYDKDWRFIHLMPEDLVHAAKALNAKRLFTEHHSKYALAKHPWHVPMDSISAAAGRDALPLITPMIGEPVYLNDSTQVFKKWWSAN